MSGGYNYISGLMKIACLWLRSRPKWNLVCLSAPHALHAIADGDKKVVSVPSGLQQPYLENSSKVKDRKSSSGVPGVPIGVPIPNRLLSQVTTASWCSCDRDPSKHDQNRRWSTQDLTCWTLMDATETINTTNMTVTITRPTQSQKKRKLIGTPDISLIAEPERVLKKRPTICASATPVVATLITVNAYNKVDSEFRRVLGISDHQRVLDRTHRQY